jgi:hypothetical protein
MSSVIDKVKVKAGRLIKVWNTKRPKFSNAKREYFSIWVEDANGSNERCLLFTDKEIERAEYRAQRNIEDLTDKDFLTDLLD